MLPLAAVAALLAAGIAPTGTPMGRAIRAARSSASAAVSLAKDTSSSLPVQLGGGSPSAYWSTAAGNVLIVAAVQINSSSGGGITSVSLTGDGLSWQRQVYQTYNATQDGVAVFTAYSTAKVTSVRTTLTASGSWASLTGVIHAFTGASSTIGSTAAIPNANEVNYAATITCNTTQPNSIIVAGLRVAYAGNISDALGTFNSSSAGLALVWSGATPYATTGSHSWLEYSWHYSWDEYQAAAIEIMKAP